MIEHINLFNNGLNVNPIPLEFSQSMSTTKELAGMQSKINQIVDYINNIDSQATIYTDAEIKIIMDILNGSNSLDAQFLKGNSITMDKLNVTTLSMLNDRIVSYVGSIMKFVSFGLDDTGYFVAYSPTSWNEIIFSTSEIGELLLDLKEE